MSGDTQYLRHTFLPMASLPFRQRENPHRDSCDMTGGPRGLVQELQRLLGREEG